MRSRLLLATLGMLILFLAGCAVNPVTGKKELALFQVSQDEEVAMGKQSFPQAVQQLGAEYPDPQLENYINNVGLRLAKVSERPDLPYQFRIVNDSSPNAFALPGGFIAISRGLLANIDNEAQLAAVLGHEIGHVTARHSVQGIQRSSLLNAGMAVLTGVTDNTAYGSIAQQAGALTANLLESSYSREQEREADQLGINYMVRAEYDPIGAVQLQEFFYRKLEGGAEPQWLSGLFRTHPFSKERMLANQDYIRSHYPQVLGNRQYSLRTDTFQAATAELKKHQHAYDLYDQATQLESQGNLSQAIATYLQAATELPDEYLILTGLGNAYQKAEDMQSAKRYLAQAVKVNGDYFKSRLGLGYVYLQLKDSSKAVPQLEASMKLMPTAPGAYFLAQGYEQTGKTQQAVDLYGQLAQADATGKYGQAATARLKALGVK